MSASGSTNGSILGLIQRLLGLSPITWFLIPATKTPNLRTNSAWNHPINDDAAGCFQLYYQNLHGVPQDEVTLDHDLKALARTQEKIFMQDRQSKQSPNPCQQFINDLILYIKDKQRELTEFLKIPVFTLL
jgi:hypothetical protein